MSSYNINLNNSSGPPEVRKILDLAHSKKHLLTPAIYDCLNSFKAFLFILELSVRYRKREKRCVQFAS